MNDPQSTPGASFVRGVFEEVPRLAGELEGLRRVIAVVALDAEIALEQQLDERRRERAPYSR